MPNPSFIPVIGGGFDQVAAQQYGWANFNRGVEEDNLRRMEQANRDYNNWLLQTNALQRQDVDTANQTERIDEATRYNRWLQDRAATEGARQFDVSALLTREQINARKQAEKDAIAEKARLEKAQLATIGNLAKSLVPEVKTAAKDYEQANAEHEKALMDFKGLSYQLQQEFSLPEDKVTYDPRMNEFRSVNRNLPIPPEYAGNVARANEALRRGEGNYMIAQQNFKAKNDAWNLVQKRAFENGLTIQGAGKKAYIYSPVLDKSFGEMVEEAKKEAPPVSRNWTLPPELSGPTPQQAALGSPFGVPISTGEFVPMETSTGTTPAPPVPVQPPVNPVRVAPTRSQGWWPIQGIKDRMEAIKKSGRIPVRSPDGIPGSVPVSQLKDALEQGFTSLV